MGFKVFGANDALNDLEYKIVQRALILHKIKFDMTTLIITAVAGWLLFAGAACLYFIGNRLNSEESNALAIYSLALLLSEDFRAANRAGFEAAIRAGRLRDVEMQGLIYGLAQGVTKNAKKYYKNEVGDLNTISLVRDALTKEA